MCDNLGYGDVGCYGSELHRTPHVDALAREGVRMTAFYATSGVCTPSRASLMTACYPLRVGMHLSTKGGAVLQPVAKRGLHPQEVTIAEVLRDAGYATTCIGKWHLGDQPQFLPTRQGFGEYFGIPYSDDMTARDGQPWPPLPLMRGERVVEAPADRATLTKRYTEAAVEFIRRNRSRPFFLYVPHAMPGSTRAPFASEAFVGRSKNGPYGDSVEEIDWSTGEILRALKDLDLDRRTIVIWSSDNGAPRRDPLQGRNTPLGGWGYTTAEGGMRVPCIVRWPGRIPAGVDCEEVATMMDWLPTFAATAGVKPPSVKLDGHDILPLLQRPTRAKSPYKAFLYYQGASLHAVRSGKWKLRVAGPGRRDNARGEPRLFDLSQDSLETRDVAAENPTVVARLMEHIREADADLGDGKQAGAGVRPAGHVPQPVGLVK